MTVVYQDLVLTSGTGSCNQQYGPLERYGEQSTSLITFWCFGRSILKYHISVVHAMHQGGQPRALCGDSLLKPEPS